MLAPILRPGYIEGRLRIADRERARRLAKQQAAAGASGPEGDGAGGGAGSEQELRQAAAQADAVMAELLEAEEADKVWRMCRIVRLCKGFRMRWPGCPLKLAAC